VRRWRTTAAMLRQLASVETLVPPNFSTIHSAAAPALIAYLKNDKRD